MKRTGLILIALCSGAWAQSVTGPNLGYAVDPQGGLHRIDGLPTAAHFSSVLTPSARIAMGGLVLLTTGEALQNGLALPGRWADLQPGLLLDETGRKLLVATSQPWELALPARARLARVADNGQRVLVLLETGELLAFGPAGQLLYRLPGSEGGLIAFIPDTDRVIAFDPATGTLSAIDSNGLQQPLRTLETARGATQLAVDATGNRAILLDPASRSLWLVPLTGGALQRLTAPEAADQLIPLQDSAVFQLTLNPARPIWLLRPGAEEPLLVIPALPGTEVAQ